MNTRTHEPTKLDRLTTHALMAQYQSATCRGARMDSDPVTCLHLARSIVARHGGMGHAYKREAVVQHLYGSLVDYCRLFAPRGDWWLASADTERAELRWRCEDPRVPAVVDVISATGLPAADIAFCHPGSVVRLCNLANYRGSVLVFPGEATAVPWCPADDPIRSGIYAMAVTA